VTLPKALPTLLLLPVTLLKALLPLLAMPPKVLLTLPRTLLLLLPLTPLLRPRRLPSNRLTLTELGAGIGSVPAPFSCPGQIALAAADKVGLALAALPPHAYPSCRGDRDHRRQLSAGPAGFARLS